MTGWRRPRFDLHLGLSRELWLVQAGIFINTLGWGAVLPFEIIYLHEGRGFSLAVAGLVVGLLTGTAVVASPIAGPLIDRFGARAVAAGAGIALAAGYAGLALAQSEPVAFLAAALGGIGNGALSPAQSTLIATLSPADRRHNATAVSRVATNAGFGLGGALGGAVAALGMAGLVGLFLLNALSYLVYVAVLVAAVHGSPRRAVVAGGYRQVLRDRAFSQLVLVNVAIIAVGWGVPSWVIPPFASDGLGLRAELIGLLFLANALTVVAAQLPIAKLAEGRRRAVLMAIGGVTFAGAFVLVLLAPELGGAGAYLALLVAAVTIGVGECFYTATLAPLVADLAPESLRGRYMATIGLSWWIGLAIAPLVGTPLLAVSPGLTFALAAGVAVAAAAWLVTLDRALPREVRITPVT